MNGSLTRTTSFHSATHLSKTAPQTLPRGSNVLAKTPSSSPPLRDGVIDKKTSVHSGNESSQPQLSKGKPVVLLGGSEGTSLSTGGGTAKDSSSTGGDGKSSGTNGKHVGQQIIKFPADQGGPPPSLEAKLLRDALLQRISPREAVTSKHKVWFLPPSIDPITSAGITVALNAITMSAGSPENWFREANIVKQKRLLIAGTLEWYPVSQQNIIPDAIPVRIVVWNDKIPTTPGTPMACWSAGSNPPTGTTDTVFQRLGTAITAFGACTTSSIRDPILYNLTHVYRDETLRHPMTPAWSSAETGGATVSYTGMQHQRQILWDIPLHDLTTTFVAATTNIQQNALYLSAIVDHSNANAGFAWNFSFQSQLWFEDAYTN